MASARMEIPVFLPGNNRDWRQVEGIAIISEENEGEIYIKLRNPDDAKRLVEMAQNGVLFQVSFDYKASDETIDKINTKY